LDFPLPPKPKPKYLGKIKNSGGGLGSTDSTTLMRFQNNLERGVQLSGYGYLPPLVVNSLVTYNQIRAAYRRTSR